MSRRLLTLLLACTILVVVFGCQGEQSGNTNDKNPPAVPVALPVEREVTPYEEFNGQLNAVDMVDLKARVTGFVTKYPFREGSEVRKGDLLFEIDPRPYQAQLDNALAQVKLNEASLKLAKVTYERDLAAGIATAPQQLDQDKAAVEEAQERLNASKASTEVYKLNLEFTQVRSPIDGQVSRYYLTKGNLVNQDQTLLSTVVSLDPMYAYFNMDEPTYLRLVKAMQEGHITQLTDGGMLVLMGLQNETDYPHVGEFNFLNNQVNSGTGSISVRGVFSNPALSKNLPKMAASMTALLAAPLNQGPLLACAPVAATPPGVRLLKAGMFVKIRLPMGKPAKQLLVIDRAILQDQGLKYVYVVDEENKVQYRRITTRSLEPDGLRVVDPYRMTSSGEEGIKTTDRIVVGGLQQVRPKTAITPDQRPMPTLAPGSTDSIKAATKESDKAATKQGGKATKK
jgi:membrane fusion protein, multidrug efflux system